MQRIPKLLELLQQNPNDCFLLHALGLESIKENELEKAISYFQQALQFDENYVGSYYHLAKTLEKTKKTDDAISIYKKGIFIAQKLKDNHAKNELQMALDDISDE